MIDKTLSFLAAELNGFLGMRFPSNEEHAVVRGLPVDDGANRLVLSLVSVEREAAGAAGPAPVRNSHVLRRPPLHLNLQVLLSASCPQNYLHALQLLSVALGHFQARAVFDANSGPHFPRELDRLQLELVNLGIHDLSNLWSLMGGQHLPSALYKVRMLTLSEDWIDGVVPAVGGVDIRVGS
jgi:hypothetical protein